jgi:hypothetical protein
MNEIIEKIEKLFHQADFNTVLDKKRKLSITEKNGQIR